MRDNTTEEHKVSRIKKDLQYWKGSVAEIESESESEINTENLYDWQGCDGKVVMEY